MTVNQIKIIGIVLVKNEDLYIEQALRNILEFCDEVIVTDNESSDDTYAIVSALASTHSKIRLSRISHPRESHDAIAPYAGTNTWIFAVDGDEIYDPEGLKKMKQLLTDGRFNNTWSVLGNVLNCTKIDVPNKKAIGYLAPPSRSMTKLYNFSLIESWTGCPERLHSGVLKFKSEKINYHHKHEFYREFNWDDSCFRCLHAVFVPRSSSKRGPGKTTKLNPSEVQSIRSAFERRSFVKFISRFLRYNFGKDWKTKNYRKGSLTEKDITFFFSQ